MLIDGKWVGSSSDETALIRNPANGEPVAQIPVGTREDARKALEASHRAFPHWCRLPAKSRAEILHEAGERVRAQVAGIARLLTLEQGKPLKDAEKEILFASEVLDYYAEEGKRIFGEWIPTISPSVRSYVIKQPVGPVAVITPWNFPVDLLAWKVAPALAAGCTVVAKPASGAPLAASDFIRCIADAPIPAGVLNLVLGKGHEVGEELVENPLSRKIAFTGETATGKVIMEKAAKYVKRISLELGGQCPFIVCHDASLDQAAVAAVRRAFSNMGQICISVNRIYVAERIADPFIEKFLARTKELRIGNGLDPDVDLGPMFNEEGRQKTKEHIADALARGAKLLCGGREPEGQEYKNGFFFLPTVLVDVDHSMKVMREETFGPVAPIMRVKSLDEALELANDTRYGLAAYIFTNDLSRALYAAEKLEAGGVGININDVSELMAPFGGWKESGLGRELSHYGLEEYLEIKHVRLQLDIH